MRFISSTPIELSYRGSVLAPHTRLGQLQFFGHHAALTERGRGEERAFSIFAGFVQFCPVVSNFVHEPSAAALSTPAIYRRVGGNG